MLLLLFHLGEERFALASSSVVEVLPRVELRRLPHAPPYLPGLFMRRGQAVPMLDLRVLVQGRPCSDLLSSRIMVVRYAWAGAAERRLGLLAEQVTETVRKEQRDLVPTGIRVAAAPYLGPLVADERGLIQVIELERLLPEEARAALFAAEGA